jgi:hypothetical protein
MTSMQPEDLGTPAAMAADELQEDTAGAHVKLRNANLGRKRRAIVSLKRYRDTLHVGRQSAGAAQVRDAG